MLHPENICSNLSVNAAGHLCFAGQDTTALAERFGTPLYLMDEARIRANCRLYLEAFRKYFPAGSHPAYAGKACSFRRLIRIVTEEGMRIDTVSCGEILTALTAGCPAENLVFHGNNKTDADIVFALERGVGCFVVDHETELLRIDALAAPRGLKPNVILRLTPGIDPHTYEAVATGKVDSKFGTAIETGQADALIARALTLQNLQLLGYHCHVGSQVFGEDVFERAAVLMLNYCDHIRKTLGFTATLLDLGGGYGVRYTEDDPQPDHEASLRSLAATIESTCAALDYPAPAIVMEPGRSIVADAGLTLYTAGNVKRITGYKNYVSIDGGMPDNPRYALYGARYTVYSAGRMLEEPTLRCDLAGRCCESGDVIQPNILLPESTARGDIIAVCTTGAYNYSMASNYNRLPRPPIVLLKDGEATVAVRRESLEDLLRLDEA